MWRQTDSGIIAKVPFILEVTNHSILHGALLLCSLWSLNVQKINCDNRKNNMDSLSLASPCLAIAALCRSRQTCIFWD